MSLWSLLCVLWYLLCALCYFIFGIDPLRVARLFFVCCSLFRCSLFIVGCYSLVALRSLRFALCSWFRLCVCYVFVVLGAYYSSIYDMRLLSKLVFGLWSLVVGVYSLVFGSWT